MAGRGPLAVQDWQRLDFAGIAHPVILPDDAALISALARVTRGWPVVRSAFDRPLEPGSACTWLAFDRGGYRLHSTHLDTALTGLPLASAVCGVLADLAQSWSDRDGGSLALHCAAAVIGGRLVAFAGSARAGKSTLAARLTAEPDIQVFCDDMLPIAPDGTGRALGMAPRLRLPLPDRASPGFRAHVAAHLGPSDGRYGYVVTDNVAPHGTSAPLAALVVLDRRDGVPARLHALAPGEAARHLLRQNMTDLTGPDAALDLVARVAKGLICARLVYSDLEDAVAQLGRAFAGGGLELAPPVADDPAPPAALADPETVWQRAANTTIRRSAGAAFVWRLGEDSMWHLNPVAEAIWRLLDIPGSANDLADALAETFADVARARLLDDTRSLLGAMQDAGLIVSVA